MNLYGYCVDDPVNFTDPDGLGRISSIKEALKKIYKYLGGKLPKGKPGKFGSPQRGTSKKGYRLDPAHPDAPPGSPESVCHINWWDFTKGKRGSGGIWGAERLLSVGASIGVLTFGDNALGQTVDLFNPLSDVQDAIELIDSLNGALEESLEESLGA